MLRRMLKLGAALAATAVVALPVAQAGPSVDDAEKVFDFEGDTIETDFLKPDAAMVESIVRTKKHSLIKIRADFIDEIVKSAEDI